MSNAMTVILNSDVRESVAGVASMAVISWYAGRCKFGGRGTVHGMGNAHFCGVLEHSWRPAPSSPRPILEFDRGRDHASPSEIH